MGTAVRFDFRSGVAPAALDEAVEFLHWVDRTFSVHRDDSAIRRIGRGDLALDDAPPVVGSVIARCEELRSGTDGWFDHRPDDGPYPIDPSGYVKGWSIDEAAAILRDAGGDGFCISAGGDVVMSGEPQAGSPWKVGIRHPQRVDSTVAVVTVPDGAVATSGRYERGEHIWPRSRTETKLISATVIGPNLGTADALATALLAGNGASTAWMRAFPGYEILLVDCEFGVRHTGGVMLADRRGHGGGGPPPPFNNAIYQSVAAGSDAAPVGLYLWDKRSSVADGVINPFVDVAIDMTNQHHGRLVQGNKTVGHVTIDAPAGADVYGVTGGPSFLGTAAVSGLDVGILVTTFSTDPDVTGDYTITFRMNNGNTQELFVTAE
ncbi:MAG: FAD:protein FMN transferase [Actinomycetota bacterium]|nr:FAD:protein FMN transferase [Actinomycetota bacterium]